VHRGDVWEDLRLFQSVGRYAGISGWIIWQYRHIYMQSH
jgi:hypothetical protein